MSAVGPGDRIRIFSACFRVERMGAGKDEPNMYLKKYFLHTFFLSTRRGNLFNIIKSTLSKMPT